MSDDFLYKKLDHVSQMGFLDELREVPTGIKDNLNPDFELRPYQIEAFTRFLHCFAKGYEGKESPLHLLFNMATGSGKTLIMAGLMLYLYEKGYRNFLFFVNALNIIEKTRDNFLNPLSSKYLFNEIIRFGSEKVAVTPVTNFEGVNENNINICFTTIQKLHQDLNSEKENAITMRDFSQHKIVLLADEAHHVNVKTKSGQDIDAESWEDTVERIFGQNSENILLEFTATHDYETSALKAKYFNKVIYRYDLRQFRNERFSKDVILVQSDLELEQRILQALILSQYKQEVAAKYRIRLKPVILFKAHRTIAQSKENKTNFHRLIDGLTAQHIASVRNSELPLLQRAFQFFEENGISDTLLAERLKWEFREDRCLSVNDEREKEHYQLLVNSLESEDNRVRAIFAVQKLNEGWDVLNLFDIVRCYETRDAKAGKPGKTTVAEAQLIGRGARYFPFVLPDNEERFRRKFDADLVNELRILEELHYHSIRDNRYIPELRAALVAEGMLDGNDETRTLKLKDSFKKSVLYENGVVWLNERRPKDYSKVASLADFGVSGSNYAHTVATGKADASAVFSTEDMGTSVRDQSEESIKVQDIERNIVQAAIARNPFFTFASLKRYFPNLKSMREFVTSDAYLGGLTINFVGLQYRPRDVRKEKLAAVGGLLVRLDAEIRQRTAEYEGSSDFVSNRISAVFKDKELKVGAHQQPAAAEAERQFQQFVSAKEWFAFDALYATSEEKNLVRFLDRSMESLKNKYPEVYLLRNEKHFALYNFTDGQAFEPDFVLFLLKKNGEALTLQLFMEPKGKHLLEHDQWKEDFLLEIQGEFAGATAGASTQDKTGKHRVIGLPFYNSGSENRFKESLYQAVGLLEGTQ